MYEWWDRVFTDIEVFTITLIFLIIMIPVALGFFIMAITPVSGRTHFPVPPKVEEK